MIDSQYGFQSNSGDSSAVIYFMEYIAQQLNDSSIKLIKKKAFDAVGAAISMKIAVQIESEPCTE